MPNKNCEILWGGRNIALHGLRFEISVFGFWFSVFGIRGFAARPQRHWPNACDWDKQNAINITNDNTI